MKSIKFALKTTKALHNDVANQDFQDDGNSQILLILIHTVSSCMNQDFQDDRIHNYKD